MDSGSVGEIWEKNAATWVKLSRAGYDIFRDYLNAPGFFSMLPNVNNKAGLDLGCGEGYNTRLLAKKGAKMTGCDISPTLIRYADEAENINPLGIQYVIGDATQLVLPSKHFDFITACSVLMDIPELSQVLAEIYRMLKPDGFLQFSITHPCFWKQQMDWVTGSDGHVNSLVCCDYFDSDETINEWTLGGVDEASRQAEDTLCTPLFKRKLSDWINALSHQRFHIEVCYEPQPKLADIEKYPILKQAAIVAFFIILRCRKLD